MSFRHRLLNLFKHQHKAPTQRTMASVSMSKFSVPQQTKKQVKKNGAYALAKAYRKYHAPMPSRITDSQPIKAAAEGTASGDVEADPSQFDAEYLCPVSIGGETLHLDFDSGSSDLWVFSNKLTASESSGHSVYKPSSTFKAISGATWNISYGDGSGASGTVGTDVVEVGGATVQKQAVELATKVSQQFVQDVDSDGLLGLAFSSINTVTPKQQLTFFDNIKSELDMPLFTADLRHNEPGTYDFGFIDDTKYTGEISYTPVDSSQGFWSFTASGYAVGSDNPTRSSFDAIADTGTSLLLLPDDIVTAYYGQIKGAKNDQQQGGWTVPANATLPSLSITVGDYTGTIDGSLMTFAPVSSSTSFGALQSNEGMGLSILGDIWFKSQFVVFMNDGSNPQLGFAAKPTSSTTSNL